MLSRGQAPGIIGGAAAPPGSPYEALGTVLYESAGGAALSIPFDSGVVQGLAGTIGVRVMWSSIATQQAAAGSDARAILSSNRGVVLHNLTNGALREKLVGYTAGTTTAAAALGDSGSGRIVAGTHYSCLLRWDGSEVRGRIGAIEHAAAHALEPGSWAIGDENIWIGTTAAGVTTSWNLAGAIRKAVIYAEALDATNRAALITLLDGEGP